MFTAKDKHFDGWSLVAGIIFIVAAILVFMKPFATFKALCVILGIVALCIGMYHIVLHKQLQQNLKMSEWLVILNAVIDILIGLLLVFSQMFSFYLIAIAFALWFIVDSVLDMHAVYKAQKKSSQSYYWLVMVGGMIGIIIGVVLLFIPLFSDTLAVIFIGVYFAVEGVKLIVRSF